MPSFKNSKNNYIYLSLFNLNQKYLYSYEKTNLREIINCAKNALVKNGYKILKERKKIKVNKKNLLIETFTKKHILYLKNIKKKYPKTQLYCLLSEKIIKNNFNREINFYKYILYNFIRFLNFGFLKSIEYKFWERLIILKKNKNLFDKFISIHPGITNSYDFIKKKKKINLYLILSKKKFILNNNNKIKIFGQITNFRIKKYNFLKELVKKLNLNNKIIFSENYHHGEFIFNYNKKSTYSLDISKHKNWKYSSPTRILSSINDGRIPVVYKRYNDHPIDKINYKINKNLNSSIKNLAKNKKIIFKNLILQYKFYEKFALKKNKKIKNFF